MARRSRAGSRSAIPSSSGTDFLPGAFRKGSLRVVVAARTIQTLQNPQAEACRNSAFVIPNSLASSRVGEGSAFSFPVRHDDRVAAFCTKFKSPTLAKTARMGHPNLANATPISPALKNRATRPGTLRPFRNRSAPSPPRNSMYPFRLACDEHSFSHIKKRDASTASDRHC
jgi:hypothetical protein